MRRLFANVVQLDDQRIATKNFAPGQRVYDEDLYQVDGAEFRTWDPTRSKLGAYLVKGGRYFPVEEKSRIVYLGAANGTTVSHVSDVARDGLVVAVEFSPRSFRDLVNMSTPRQNIVPVMADAWRPELYDRYVGKVDLVFQDIAQRQQAQIFIRNLERFRPPWGIISVKARSVNVAAHPREVYDAVAKLIEETSSYEVLEVVDLGPFEKDHAAIVVRPRTGPRKAPQPEPRAERDERPRDAPRDDRQRDTRQRDDRGFRGKPQGGGGGGGGYGRPRGPPPGGQGGHPPRRDSGGGGGGGGGGYPPKRRDDAPPRNDRPDRRGWR